MNIFELKYVQVLPISLEVAWEFFSNPLNLEKITPKNLGFKVLSKHDTQMKNGSIVTYQVRPLFSMPITWVTEIKHIEQPLQFVDEQRFGPYRFWFHRHTFKKVEDGVEMTDLVYYALSLPLIDSVVNQIIVKPKLESIFNYRQKKLNELF